MADEQFPWLDWPHNYAPPNLNGNTPHVEENSNSLWRSPFDNSSSNPTLRTLNENNNKSQYYSAYQQQDESYVRLEDVVSYPSYRLGPPPAREYQGPTSYAENTSRLPLPAPSLSQQSPKPPAGRQLLNPMTQAISRESPLASDVYSGHNAKRRRIDSPAASKAASPVYSQVRSQPAAQDTRSSSQYTFSPSLNAAQSSKPLISHPTTQPAAPRNFQQIRRIGSQYVASVQTLPTSQIPPRTASPATSQSSTCTSQYAPQVQFKATSRAPSTASPQITAQQIARNSSQCTPSQTLSKTVAPSASQPTINQTPQHIPRPHSEYCSLTSTDQSPPQTVASSDTQIRPPQQRSQSISRPNNSPQTRPQALLRNPALQSTAPRSTQPAPSTGLKSTSQPVSTPQLPPQMAEAPHSQPAHGVHGQFAAYTFQPENPADRSHLKRRMDIVSGFKDTDAAQKVTYDPKTIARNVLIASGRHPTEPTLNHHLFGLRDLFSAVDINSDLETFRWDLVDPSGESRDIKAKATFAPKQTVFMQTSQTAPQTAVQVAPPANNISLPLTAIQKQHHAPQPTFQQPPTQPQQPTPQHQPKPQVQLQNQRPPVPSPAPRPQPKPETPSTPEFMEKRRRGRPPGSTSKPKAAAVAVVPPAPTTSYPVYACRWGNCQSELHNLELLKKHLFKIHVSYQITCGWKGCAYTGTLPAAELMKHVKKEHLDSLAWKLGDGPTVPTSVDRDSSSKTGPLTILESIQPGNEDSLIFPAEYGSIRAFNRVHGIHSQQDKAREIFKAVQRLKEHVGVGLDPGGCELATPLRNERVSNDEDIYEIRYGS